MNKPVRPEWIYGAPVRKPWKLRMSIGIGLLIFALVLVLTSGCKEGAEPSPKPGDMATVASSTALTGGDNSLAIQAKGKAPKDFCATLNTRDMALCRLIETQPAYGTEGPDGDSGESPNGKAIIKEIASQNLPKNEVRMYLEGEYEAYAYHFRGSTITMDVRNLPSTDCHYELGYKDKDGKPGGMKLVETKIVCP